MIWRKPKTNLLQPGHQPFESNNRSPRNPNDADHLQPSQEFFPQENVQIGDNISDVSLSLCDVVVPGSAGILQGDADPTVESRPKTLDFRVQGVIGERQKVLFQPIIHHFQAVYGEFEV